VQEHSEARPYIHPLPKAIKLVRTLCQASHVIAERCVSGGLLGPLMRFIVGGTPVPAQTTHGLFVEAVRTWTVCTSYGLYLHPFPSLFSHFLPHTALSNLSSLALSRSATTLCFFETLISAGPPYQVCFFFNFLCLCLLAHLHVQNTAGLAEVSTALLPALVPALMGTFSCGGEPQPDLFRVLAAALHLLAAHVEQLPSLPSPL